MWTVDHAVHRFGDHTFEHHRYRADLGRDAAGRVLQADPGTWAKPCISENWLDAGNCTATCCLTRG